MAMLGLHAPEKREWEDRIVETEKSRENSTGGSSDDAVDLKAEKKLLRKVDVHIIPPLFTVFLLAFLDRTNIGNARIQGMEKDLRMSGNDYSIALLAFFVTYIVFEIPSNIILKRVAPSTWLSLITVLWGIATVGEGLVNNLNGLLAMRLLIGLFEAGLFPGAIYMISMYYQRYELQWRFNLFFCAAIIAGAFGGLFAYALAQMEGVGGYGGWRWIFIIEGLLTIVIGVFSKWWIPDWPETASFLNDEERALLLARLRRDTGAAKMSRLDKKAGMRCVKDWKIYLSVISYFGIVNTPYATSFFIPTILQEFGYRGTSAQVYTIPIFVVATACALCTAVATDRMKHRYGFVIFGILVGTIGYAILLNQNSVPVSVKYFALFLVTSGGYIAQPVIIVWLSNNVSGHYKRAIASASQIGFGNCGGIVASNIFITAERPWYRTGYGTSLGLMWLCALSCTLMFVGVILENRKRDRGGRDYRYNDPDLDNMGDDHPDFRFTL